MRWNKIYKACHVEVSILSWIMNKSAAAFKLLLSPPIWLILCLVMFLTFLLWKVEHLNQSLKPTWLRNFLWINFLVIYKGKVIVDTNHVSCTRAQRRVSYYCLILIHFLRNQWKVLHSNSCIVSSQNGLTHVFVLLRVWDVVFSLWCFLNTPLKFQIQKHKTFFSSFLFYLWRVMLF